MVALLKRVAAANDGNLAGRETDLQAMEWVNPHPEKEIASLDVIAKCHRRGAITFLLGLTAVE